MRPAVLTCAGVLALLAGCVSQDMPEPHEGAELFADNCAACHDYRATGGEPLIGGQVAPDLTRIAARNEGDFPRAEVLSTIDGYVRGNHPGGRVMPEFGVILRGDPVPLEVDGTLTPTPRPLAALLLYLESIQD